MNIVIYLMYAIIFVAVFFTIFNFFRMAKDNEAIQSASKGFAKAVGKNEQQRKKDLMENAILEGELNNTSFFYKLDVMILQSGLKRKIPILTTESFLFFELLLSLVSGVIVHRITGEFLVALIAAILLCSAVYVVIYIIAGQQYAQTERCIMQFANLLDNYSKTSDDIIEILGKIGYYLDEPLKTAVIECHIEAVNTGDITTAFRNLSVKIEHPKFKEIVRNLEICRKHEANYSTIIKDIRYILKEYLRAKEERKAEETTGRISMAFMLGIGAVILGFVNGFISKGTVFTVLMSSLIGQCILLYFVIVTIVIILNVIKVDKN